MEDNKPVIVMATVTINEHEPMALAEYLSATQPLLDRAGAKIIDRFRFVNSIVGKEIAQTAIFVEYPSKAALDSVFQSSEYSLIKEKRDRAFTHYSVALVCSDLAMNN